MRRIKNVAAILAVLLISLMPVGVYADFGPKPSIQVFMKNAPDLNCYVTIMKDNLYHSLGSSDDIPEKMYTYQEGDWSTYLYKDAATVSKLEHQYTTVHGMRKYTFGFYNRLGIGLPQRFRILLQYETGEIIVSEPQINDEFTKNIVYDAKSNKAKAVSLLDLDYYRIHFDTIKMLATCILITLLVEVLFARLLFTIRRYKVIIITNICTQIALFAAVYSTYRATFFFFPLIFLIMELIIWWAEYMVYKRFIPEIRKGKLIGYVLTANLFSAVLGVASLFLG